jgi:hypothetical protein
VDGHIFSYLFENNIGRMNLQIHIKGS